MGRPHRLTCYSQILLGGPSCLPMCRFEVAVPVAAPGLTIFSYRGWGRERQMLAGCLVDYPLGSSDRQSQTSA